jgi:hypothetical protein
MNGVNWFLFNLQNLYLLIYNNGKGNNVIPTILNMRGKTINIYMPDGNPRSIKICEITDSIVKAIFIPRNKLSELSNREEMHHPGVYFLFGEENEIGRPTLYIGEAEDLLTRVKQQNANKDFWNTAICFVSEKKNLNKAHIKYLENHACAEAKRINKCVLGNSVTPTQSSLTNQDVDLVLSFFDDLKILLSTLGYPIFVELKRSSESTFICKGKNAYARGEYTEEGMVVFKGSKAQIGLTDSAGDWIKNIRINLLNESVLSEVDGVYVFTEDYTFNSPSAAAATVLGRNVNGWTAWKTKEGITLDERFRKDDNV